VIVVLGVHAPVAEFKKCDETVHDAHLFDPTSNVTQFLGSVPAVHVVGLDR
jgi:hypothetical protein